MRFVPYTSDDYVAGVPCIYKWRDTITTVSPLSLGPRHPFDGGRRLTFRWPNGYTTFRIVDGCELKPVLYKMIAPSDGRRREFPKLAVIGSTPIRGAK